jgi:hypothetical protein
MLRKILGSHFHWGLGRHSAAERIRPIKEANDLIGNRAFHFPAPSILHHPVNIYIVPVHNFSVLSLANESSFDSALLFTS